MAKHAEHSLRFLERSLILFFQKYVKCIKWTAKEVNIFTVGEIFYGMIEKLTTP
jgi:hypothetical protein